MRLFIAIDFPQKVKEEIFQSIENIFSFSPGVSWTKKENLHLTLKFLGNIKQKTQIEESKIRRIKQEMEESIKGIKSFTLYFDDLGYFKSYQLIVWLGVRESGQLSELMHRLDKGMSRLGFPAEKRAFTPHITVGRGKRIRDDILPKIKTYIEEKSYKLPRPILISEVFLMESHLSPLGPTYEALAKFPLS